MSWLKPKPKDPSMIIQPPAASRIEVELHKGASEDAAAKADQTNKHLTDLLVNNGFTLKIYMAAGHQYPPPKKETKKK